jgi:subtilisin family serine protease
MINAAIDRLEADARSQPPPVDGIQPHLVFRVPVATGTLPNVLADLLQELGIAVVSIEPDGAVIAFRGDTDLSQFKEAVRKYQRGPGIDQKTGLRNKSTRYDVFEIIEADQMRRWGRSDRVGRRLGNAIGKNGESIDAASLYVLDVELWHRGTMALAKASVAEVQKLVQGMINVGEKFSDTFIGDALCLARITLTGEKLSRLLEMDAVAEVDLPPQPIFDSYAAAAVTPRDFPTPPRPVPDGPRVCILDSGVASSHKLLANNIGHEEAILADTSSPSDANGHGTMVGGLAVFGDIRACYTEGRFSSPITLFSARVTNNANRFDDEKRIINQMRHAIEVFLAAPYNCKVFNISLGCAEPLLSDGNKRQGEWAQALDFIARDLKVLFVVSAGNHDASIATLTRDAEMALTGYPHYLFESAANLCDPATAAIPITVGALAEHAEPAVRKGTDKDDFVRPIAQVDQPTPSTRIGPGLNDAIKPEFVAYGGNSTFHGSGPSRSTRRIDPGVAVMSFSHQPILDQLFSYSVGTSFAAPRVARLAALVWHRIRQDFGQDPDPNLVRAVLATATVMPEAARSLIERTKGEDFIPHVCGYGMVDEELALESSDRRITLVAQGKITIDTFQIFQVPVPEEFQDDSRSKKIIVALAYDPPVRRRRAQYLGVDMCSYLFRNKSVDEIVEAYRAITKKERKSKSVPGAFKDSSKCKLSPGVKALGTSTLQRAEWTSRTRLQDSDTFHLLVRADRNWAPSEITEQDFGVAVALESNNPLLYGVIRERIPVRQRTRLRQ